MAKSILVSDEEDKNILFSHYQSDSMELPREAGDTHEGHKSSVEESRRGKTGGGRRHLVSKATDDESF